MFLTLNITVVEINGSSCNMSKALNALKAESNGSDDDSDYEIEGVELLKTFGHFQ